MYFNGGWQNQACTDKVTKGFIFDFCLILVTWLLIPAFISKPFHSALICLGALLFALCFFMWTHKAVLNQWHHVLASRHHSFGGSRSGTLSNRLRSKCVRVHSYVFWLTTSSQPHHSKSSPRIEQSQNQLYLLYGLSGVSATWCGVFCFCFFQNKSVLFLSIYQSQDDSTDVFIYMLCKASHGLIIMVSWKQREREICLFCWLKIRQTILTFLKLCFKIEGSNKIWTFFVVSVVHIAYGI